ncbi:hypothetical protein [Bradyrhizobium sp. SZCCHNR2035]|uniref:hypothetical protein n=1 Tax=Bradyrhizobium sp. SZCCHNR2035 TaxID=3057386 RepID=UPI002915D33D|nr:hypothetical protein [Bradyrhizobium sp. SZCCHNR2035]
MPKEQKTLAELDDIVHKHIEQNHRGPLGGAQFLKIVPVEGNPDRTWRIAHGGQAGGFGVALDEAEAELVKLYDLVRHTAGGYQTQVTNQPDRY